MTRRFTEYIYPVALEPLLENRISHRQAARSAAYRHRRGFETYHGKAIMRITGPDVQEARVLQLGGGHSVGVEAAIHAIQQIFKADECDAILLLDARSAFQLINRKAGL